MQPTRSLLATSYLLQATSFSPFLTAHLLQPTYILLPTAHFLTAHLLQPNYILSPTAHLLLVGVGSIGIEARLPLSFTELALNIHNTWDSPSVVTVEVA